MAGTTAVDAGVAVPLGHQEAMILAAAEFDRMAAQLQALSPCDWAQPTVCELWDVRAMAAHVLGMAEAQASFRQFAHDFRAAGKRSSGKMIDEMSATQVRERSAMTPGAIVSRLAAVAPKAVRARRRTPAAVRWGAMALRLSGGYHLHPRHLDAQTRHQPGDRPPHGAHRRARRPPRRRRRHRVGAPPRPAVRPHPDRQGRRPVALRGGRGAPPARCARLLLDRRRPGTRYRAHGHDGPVLIVRVKRTNRGDWPGS